MIAIEKENNNTFNGFSSEFHKRNFEPAILMHDPKMLFFGNLYIRIEIHKGTHISIVAMNGTELWFKLMHKMGLGGCQQ